MALTFGQIQEFSLENETIGAYLERMELYFQANGVAEGRRVAAFLSIIGEKTTPFFVTYCHQRTQRQVARGPVCRAQETLQAKKSGHCGAFRFLLQGAGCWRNNSRIQSGTAETRHALPVRGTSKSSSPGQTGVHFEK